MRFPAESHQRFSLLTHKEGPAFYVLDTDNYIYAIVNRIGGAPCEALALTNS